MTDNSVRLSDSPVRKLAERLPSHRLPLKSDTPIERTGAAMPYYRRVGDLPPKRHTQFRQPDGSLYAEELMGQEGFSSDSSLLYHRYAPNAIVAAEVFEPPSVARRPNHPLKPRHLQTHKLDAGGDAVLSRQYLLANDDVRLS